MRVFLRVRIVLSGLILLFGSGPPARAVSQWARLYQMPCEGCHTTYPRLNAVGLAFRRNGYRFTLNENATLTEHNLRAYIGPTWTPSYTQAGKDTDVALSGAKIHIGGPVGRSVGFLIQPTPGSAADFNMVQGMLAFGSPHTSFRLVGGRLYAWGNGGGVGAADRYVTATAPRLFGDMHGISVGGLGNGARLESTFSQNTMLALFTSDLSGASTHAQLYGVSLTHTLDRRSASAIELDAAIGSVPVAGQMDAQATRWGLFFNRALLDSKEREHWNILTGVVAGSENRAVKAGLPTNAWSSFFELDWSPHPGLTLFSRQEWERNVVAPGSGSAFTLGAAVPLTRNLRLDNDVVMHRPGLHAVQVVTRLRLVY